jgi:hypothetical protein
MFTMELRILIYDIMRSKYLFYLYGVIKKVIRQMLNLAKLRGFRL